MSSGTENSRNFQFPGKGQPPELEDDQNFRNELFEISVPFDSVPEFPEILVQRLARTKLVFMFYCIPAVFLETLLSYFGTFAAK